MINFRKNDNNKINSEYKIPDQLQSDREQVYRRYGLMKDGRTYYDAPLEKKWVDWTKQYEAFRPSSGQWQSTIVPPLTTSIIEQELAEIVNQTVRPKVGPAGPFDIESAKIMNYAIDHSWDVGSGDLELYDSLKQCLVLGNTVWQEDFWLDKRVVKNLKKIEFEKEKQKFVFEDSEVYDFNDVFGETVDLENFFIDPLARTINRGKKKANDVIRRYIMNYDTFMETFKGTVYDMFGATSYVRTGASASSDYWQFYMPPTGLAADGVEVLFYWARRPDKLILMANDVVIYNGPNPYRHKQLPFAGASDVSRLKGFWARSQPNLLESIQDELTTLRRMRIDRQHMDIYKMFLMPDRDTIEDEEGIVAPSRFLYVSDPSAVKTLEYGDINPSAYMEEDRLRQDGREVTGVNSPQPSGTATEAAIFKEATMKVLQAKVWKISREFLNDIVMLRASNISQFYSEPNIEKMVGEEKASEFRRIITNDVELKMTQDGKLLEERKKGTYFFDIDPKFIMPKHGRFYIKPISEPAFPLSKPLRQQQLDKFTASPVVQAAIMNKYWDVNKVADKYAEEYDFDSDDFKASPSGTITGDRGFSEEKLIEIAGVENEGMVGGKEIPSTPYATRGHTMLHIAFMDSDAFKQAVRQDPKVVAAFAKHIMGEDTAQKLRGGGEEEQMIAQNNRGMAGGNSTSQGIMAGGAKATNPSKVVGAEETPMGMMYK